MPVTNYYTVEGEILGEKTTGQERIDYLTDALGSVYATLDQTGQIVNTYRYKPYGGLLAKTGTGADPSFQWVGSLGYRQTGKKWSDVYVRARGYDTQTGTWPTPEPYGNGGSAASLYAYANGDPVGLSDPGGLQATGPWPILSGPDPGYGVQPPLGRPIYAFPEHPGLPSAPSPPPRAPVVPHLPVPNPAPWARDCQRKRPMLCFKCAFKHYLDRDGWRNPELECALANRLCHTSVPCSPLPRFFIIPPGLKPVPAPPPRIGPRPGQPGRGPGDPTPGPGPYPGSGWVSYVPPGTALPVRPIVEDPVYPYVLYPIASEGCGMLDPRFACGAVFGYCLKALAEAEYRDPDGTDPYWNSVRERCRRAIEICVRHSR